MKQHQVVAVRRVLVCAIGFALALTTQAKAFCQRGEVIQPPDKKTRSIKIDVDRVAKVADLAGFRCDDLVTAIAVAGAESEGYWEDLVSTNVDRETQLECSLDVGMWQINNHAHPEHPVQEMKHALPNAFAAYQIYAFDKPRFSFGDADHRKWTAYFNGAYKGYLAEAERVARPLIDKFNQAFPGICGSFPDLPGFAPPFLDPPGTANLPITILTATDPNGKVGVRGSGAGRYLAGEDLARYAVYFENLATATAPAQEVVITDQLDISTLDLSTFSLGLITFGDTLVTPPAGLSQYTTDVDLRPTRNLIVRINAGLDQTTGIATWRFISVNLVTGLPTDDPLAGFLPPDKNPPEGQGSVLFSVMPKQGLRTGTEIRNKARIVFDVNEPIDTPEWLNTIDITGPTSLVSPLAPTQFAPNFTVQWSGADEGSGIRDYTVFVSENSGAYTTWLRDTTATSETFSGQPGKTYAFYSVARDQAGNLEDAPAVPDATTRVVVDTTPPTTTATALPAANGNGWHNSDVTVVLSAADDVEGTGVKEIEYALTGAHTGGAVVAGGRTSLTFSNEGPTTLTYFARDNAGNQEAARSLIIGIDKTPPNSPTAKVTPTPIVNGWNNTAVTVSFASNGDAGGAQSGVAWCTGASSLSGETAGTVVSGTCTDAAGNTSAPTPVTVKIDRTPPTLSCSINPSILWPPNHKLVPVTASVAVMDALSGPAGFSLVSVTSSEPDNGLGDVDSPYDIQGFVLGAASTSGLLRAERSGRGNGRVYTLTYQGMDAAGNSATCSATVTVPHDQRK